MHLMSNEDPHLEEGSGDSEEDTLSILLRMSIIWLLV